MTKDRPFAAYARANQPSKIGPCLHCPNNAESRGLCVSCLRAATRKVTSGETTWEWLERKKLCVPKIKIPFNVAFDAAMKKVKPVKSTSGRKAVK